MMGGRTQIQTKKRRKKKMMKTRMETMMVGAKRNLRKLGEKNIKRSGQSEKHNQIACSRWHWSIGNSQNCHSLGSGR